MKKFIRYLRLKHQSPTDHDEHVKKKQRYEVDYTLEPFAGLTPEYMEMSESQGAFPGRGGPAAAQGSEQHLRTEPCHPQLCLWTGGAQGGP